MNTETRTKKIRLSIAVAALVLLLAGGGIWYWRSARQRELSPTSTASPLTPTELEAAAYERSQNPLKDELPKTNPFTAKTNPFDGAYKNPFDR